MTFFEKYFRIALKGRIVKISTYRKIDQYQEIHVTTVEEIYNIIVAYNKFRNLPRPAFTKDGPLLQGFYRGQSNSEWDISPSLLRSKTPEPQMLKIFNPNKKMSLFGTIAYIQHHQTGTRFIDFTTNPELSNRFSSIEELNGGIISFLDHGFMVLPDTESLNGNLRLKRQQGCFFVCGVEFDPKLSSTGH